MVAPPFTHPWTDQVCQHSRLPNSISLTCDAAVEASRHCGGAAAEWGQPQCAVPGLYAAAHGLHALGEHGIGWVWAGTGASVSVRWAGTVRRSVSTCEVSCLQLVSTRRGLGRVSCICLCACRVMKY